MTYRGTIPAVASAVTVSLVGLLIWQLARRRKVYVKVGKVKKIIFYPFKSLKGIEVEEIDMKNTGVEVNGVPDRTFMLVDKDGTLICRMHEPSLVFPDINVSGNELVITAEGMNPLRLGVKDISPDDKVYSCQIINDSVKGFDCGDYAAEWFQKFLKRSDVRVVQSSPALDKRFYAGRNAPAGGGPKSDIFFQNKEAIHLSSESSLEEVNKKLEEPISELNFRPNIVIEGSPPFAEDEWKFLKFPGGTELETTSPCGRCTITTINTTTGVRTNKEPLTSMRKFRVPKDPKLAKQLSYSPCFGILCRVNQSGCVRVGDDVFAVIKKGLYEYAVKS